jgi:E3 ubiquitin-protein ligase UBR1
MICGWIDHQVRYDATSRKALVKIQPISVSHPVIYELIGLPKNYDTLLEQVIRQACPTTGKPITDGSICLFCGLIFCSQAVCCTKEVIQGRRLVQLGGAQQHMRK